MSSLTRTERSNTCKITPPTPIPIPDHTTQSCRLSSDRVVARKNGKPKRERGEREGERERERKREKERGGERGRERERGEREGERERERERVRERE